MFSENHYLVNEGVCVRVCYWSSLISSYDIRRQYTFYITVDSIDSHNYYIDFTETTIAKNGPRSHIVSGRLRFLRWPQRHNPELLFYDPVSRRVASRKQNGVPRCTEERALQFMLSKHNNSRNALVDILIVWRR